MLFCVFLTIGISSCFVNFVKTHDNPLLLSIDQDVDIYRTFSSDNRSIFNDELIQKFVVFNSEKDKTIVARFGSFSSSATMSPATVTTSNMSVLIHTHRRHFLVPTESNTIVINTLCEFFYDKIDMSNLGDKLCCIIELHLDRKSLTNPTAVCQLRLGKRPSFCFTPLSITDTGAKSLPLVAMITATVYPHSHCDATSNSHTQSIAYAVSPSLSLSFDQRPPSVWYLAYHSTHTHSLLLFVGLPLHSSWPNENLRLPIRLVTLSPTTVDTQIWTLHCIINDRINLLDTPPNSPSVAILRKYVFSNGTHTFVTVQLQLTPGRDGELLALNVTINGDSAADTREPIAPTLQCCLRPSSVNKDEKIDCGPARIMTLSVQLNSMILIPALWIPDNAYYIYHAPNASLSRASIKVYGIMNYRDRTVSEVTHKVNISVFDRARMNIIRQNVQLALVDMNYQSSLNPWSVQLSMYDSQYTVVSPVKIWRAESWRIVLSDDILRPIKDWLVPSSTTGTKICVSSFKVARLKILCRLYMIDESGHKLYAGSDNYQSTSPAPFIDVTDLTKLSQLRILPPNVVTLEKSTDNGHFLVTANLVGHSSFIELLSPESSRVIVTTRVSVETDQNYLYVVDLQMHCVHALSLTRSNLSLDSIKIPREFESIIVSLTTDSQSLPCYLLMFLVFSDQSIERVSAFEASHYQIFRESSDSRTMITDGQLITVKWSKYANITIYESATCTKPKLIFRKKINWGEIVSLTNLYLATDIPVNNNVAQLPVNQTNAVVSSYESSNHILHMALYSLIALLALCFLCLVIHKIFCYKRPRAHRAPSASTCYNISDSVRFLGDHNKIVIKNSNNKGFSTLGKCSGNCMGQNSNKCHSNEPYPPLLPPPGPISTNYDLTINDRACCESAVDSGIELGKLSSYSSNTSPSNDLCGYSIGDDTNLYRQPSQFINPLFIYPSHKDIMDSFQACNDKPKTVAHLRPLQW